MERQSFVLSNYIITDKEFYKRTLLILLPVVLQNCINQGVNMMDTIMVGSLREVAISASSVANQYYYMFTVLCMGISAGGVVLASQYWGAKDEYTVKRVFDLVFQITIVAAVGFSVVTYFFPTWIMSIFTTEADVIAAGSGYLRITALIFLPHGISLVATNVIRSIGNAGIGLYVSLISFGVNLVCNYIFIFGKLGVPALGLNGAALGTLCARLVELAVATVYLLKMEKTLKYRPTGLLKLPRRALVGEFRRLGVPAIVSDSLYALGGAVNTIIVGHLGKEIMSAFSIVAVADRMCIVATAGMGSAASVIIGQTVGKGDFKRARKEGWTFYAMSSGIGLFAIFLVMTVGIWSVSFYNITSYTREITLSVMKASAVVVFFQAMQSALSKGILRGGGDTRFLVMADFVSQWCVATPLGYVAAHIWGWSAAAIMIVMRLDYVMKTIWLTFRMKGNRWIHQTRKIE